MQVEDPYSHLIFAVDIGSAYSKAILVKQNIDNQLETVSLALAKTKGLNKGVIVDQAAFVETLVELIEALPDYINNFSNIVITISNNNFLVNQEKVCVDIDANIVTSFDTDQALFKAITNAKLGKEYKLIHDINLSSYIDGKKVRSPLGYSGKKLEVCYQLISMSNKLLSSLTYSFSSLGLHNVQAYYPSIAASIGVASQQELESGCTIVDMGASFTTISVFKDSALVDTHVIPIGGNHVTNDVSLGLELTKDLAESLKIHFGNANSGSIDPNSKFDIPSFDNSAADNREVSKYELSLIIEARYEEWFQLIKNFLSDKGHLINITGSIILSGGSAKILGIIDLGRKILGANIRIGYPREYFGSELIAKDPGLSNLSGLIMNEYLNRQKFASIDAKNLNTKVMEAKNFKVVDKIKSWFQTNF